MNIIISMKKALALALLVVLITSLTVAHDGSKHKGGKKPKSGRKG